VYDITVDVKLRHW